MKAFIMLGILASLTASIFAADGPVRHVVHFKFKPDADEAQVKRVIAEFAALKKKIDVIEAMEWGTNVSSEGLNKGFTHCWLISFKSSADRDTYLMHPEHKKFIDVVKPVLAEALVVDFIPQK